MIYKDKEELLNIEKQKQKKEPKPYDIQIKPKLNKNKIDPSKIKATNHIYAESRVDRMEKIRVIFRIFSYPSIYICIRIYFIFV